MPSPERMGASWRSSTGCGSHRRSGSNKWTNALERNRIHLDVTVPHDVAEARGSPPPVAAGGTLVSDPAAAREFWVLADPEGNEACVCTWQDRD